MPLEPAKVAKVKKVAEGGDGLVVHGWTHLLFDLGLKAYARSWGSQPFFCEDAVRSGSGRRVPEAAPIVRVFYKVI